MADELAEIMQNFTLSSKELQRTDMGREDLAVGVKESNVSLIGKIMGEKMTHYTRVKNLVTAAWSYRRELRVVELRLNLFQFVLPIESDRERILNGGHWILDNQILVLSNRYEGIEDDDKAFHLAPLWVQLSNLPIHWMSKEAGRKIGSNFHQVRDVIIPQTSGKEGRHLKLLVTVDISQPLLRGTIMKVDRVTTSACFQYERCPNFCYNCGIVRHSERACDKQTTARARMKDNQYEIWMRVGHGKISP